MNHYVTIALPDLGLESTGGEVVVGSAGPLLLYSLLGLLLIIMSLVLGSMGLEVGASCPLLLYSLLLSLSFIKLSPSPLPTPVSPTTFTTSFDGPTRRKRHREGLLLSAALLHANGTETHF